MNLIGSRVTLILNVRALVVASVVGAETVYIERYGYEILSDSFLALFFSAFIPAFIMLIIRNRTFSYCFLFLYAAIAIQMARGVRSAYLTGAFHVLPGSIHFIWLLLFFLISVVCLGIFVAHALIGFAISVRSSGR